MVDVLLSIKYLETQKEKKKDKYIILEAVVSARLSYCHFIQLYVQYLFQRDFLYPASPIQRKTSAQTVVHEGKCGTRSSIY